MKPSDLKKDEKKTVRVNEMVYKLFKDEGYSLQKVVDDFMNEKLSVKIETKKKEK